MTNHFVINELFINGLVIGAAFWLIKTELKEEDGAGGDGEYLVTGAVQCSAVQCSAVLYGKCIG